jgi:outer membrane protein OmpA-like peptidoglycan-associated protein
MAYRRIGLALMLFFATTPGAWADDTLKALASDWPEAQVTETLSHGNDLALEQGSRFSLRVASTQGAHLAILFENPRGEVRVFVPRRTDTGDLIIPGSEINYPDMASGETLYADSPVGKAFVYLIATEQPAFGGSKVIAGDPHPWTDAHQVLALLGQPAVGRKTVTRLVAYISNPTVKDYVSKSEFVDFYTNGTRSVENADRGFRIGFKLNSADLDDFSKRQLEAVGGGMQDPSLQSYRFSIEGHTDDLGSTQYNDELSERRAQAVRDYLSRSAGVSTTRLDARGFGKSKPQVEGTSEQARAQNRRVVIRRIDAP